VVVGIAFAADPERADVERDAATLMRGSSGDLGACEGVSRVAMCHAPGDDAMTPSAPPSELKDGPASALASRDYLDAAGHGVGSGAAAGSPRRGGARSRNHGQDQETRSGRLICSFVMRSRFKDKSSLGRFCQLSECSR
jgi:hypothetical protein